jgi:hypothetical protein
MLISTWSYAGLHASQCLRLFGKQKVLLLQLMIPKITRKTARTTKKTALKPVATGPLPEAVGLDKKSLPELPTYRPPLELEFTPSESLATGLSQLETFQQLLTPAIIDRIIAATNSYA